MGQVPSTFMRSLQTGVEKARGLTLLTRAIMAKTAASGITVVVILDCASCLAAIWPSNSGALSATTT